MSEVVERKNLSAEEFIQKFNSSNSFEEAVQLLGIKEQTIKQRASKIRALGITLKDFPRKNRKKLTDDVDRIASLKKIAEESLKNTAQPI